MSEIEVSYGEHVNELAVLVFEGELPLDVAAMRVVEFTETDCGYGRAMYFLHRRVRMMHHQAQLGPQAD